MNNETKLKGQLIELRGKGWSYDKISRHLGIDRPVLLRWGMLYKDCIEAEREVNRATLDELRRLRADTLDVQPIQESHFYNLRGESAPTLSLTPNRKPRRNASRTGRNPTRTHNPRTSRRNPNPRSRVSRRRTSRRHPNPTRNPNRRRKSKSPIVNRKSKMGGLRRRFRKFMRSPLVRAALRYVIFKH